MRGVGGRDWTMMFEAMMSKSAVATVPELDPATAVAEAAALKVWLRLAIAAAALE